MQVISCFIITSLSVSWSLFHFILFCVMVHLVMTLAFPPQSKCYYIVYIHILCVISYVQRVLYQILINTTCKDSMISEFLVVLVSYNSIWHVYDKS